MICCKEELFSNLSGIFRIAPFCIRAHSCNVSELTVILLAPNFACSIFHRNRENEEPYLNLMLVFDCRVFFDLLSVFHQKP